MLMSVSLALALQVASIPPALPEDPGPERRAAAAALFPRDSDWPEYRWSINIAASDLAVEVLSERNAEASDRDFRLSERLIARARASSGTLVDDAIRCVAEPLAQRLQVADLTAFRAFATNRDNANFWSFYFSSQPWRECFAGPVRAVLAPYVDADLAAVIAETPIR